MRALALLILSCALVDNAERLAIKTFTTADGLGHNAVHRIRQDAQGWLWFATSEGLTRFDGSQFKTYGTTQGLSDRRVHDLLVTSEGEYWVATGKSACRFDPTGGRALFQCLSVKELGADYINAMLEERKGVILCGTESGLIRLVRDPAGRWQPERSPALAAASDARISALLKDRENRIWAGGVHGLYRFDADGTPRQLPALGEARTDNILSLTQDHDGGIWAGADGALYRIVLRPQPMVQQRYLTSDALPGGYVQALSCSADGRLLAGTLNGLSISTGPLNQPGQRFLHYSVANGLPTAALEDVLEDRDGNIWMATDGGGVSRISRSRLTTFDENDGLTGGAAISIFEDQAGTLCVLSRGPNGLSLSRLDSGRFRTSRLELGAAGHSRGWGSAQVIARDQAGAWWLATGNGLARYGKAANASQLAGMAPERLYTTRDGLPGENVFRVFNDSRGDIWVSTSQQVGNGLARWDRSQNRFQVYSGKDGFGAPRTSLMAAFAEDAAGHLWTGSLLSGLCRYDAGRFRLFTAEEGAPTGGIRTILRDRKGRLWFGSSRNGLGQVTDAGSEHPQFSYITSADGLSSDQVNTLSEDQWGRIYAGTSRGVDRIDPGARPPKIRHFTPADGLPPFEIEVAHRSQDGDLWFGTSRGVVRLVPEPETSEPSADGTVWVLQLRAGGVDIPVSELGVRAVQGIELAADRNPLQVDYGAIGRGAGLRYQYRLGGVGAEWSAPTAVRTVNYAGLAPGSYRLEIRAAESQQPPAVVEFRIVPPFWGQWWFRLLLLAVLAAALYAAYHYRVAQLVEMERIRTRIAADLHDDIGSSLSQISILGEVARRRLDGDRSGAQELVDQIATVSRELVDSMSDIVWAINPNRDRLQDLSQRMRHFAGDLFPSRGIELLFDAPDPDQNRTLSADVRREVFLVFKEAAHNAVRHSGCTRVEISLSFQSGYLVLTVQDNGHGFPLGQAGSGHGLTSMDERSKRIQGELKIESGAAGTAITLRVYPHNQVGRLPFRFL